MELDRHKLEEERRWRLEHYEQQVRRLVQTLVDAIQRGAKEALSRPIVYDDDRRFNHGYIDQAGALQHEIIQALNNADFGGLTRDAGELHAVMMALHTLDKLKDSLHHVDRNALNEREDDRLQERIGKKIAKLDEIEAREREGCVVGVAEGGRSVGFHRCTFPGKTTVTIDGRPGQGKLVSADDPNAIEVRLCTRHAKDAERSGSVSVYRPSAWEQEQRRKWRLKETREIAEMEEQLRGLPVGEQVKEIEA